MMSEIKKLLGAKYIQELHVQFTQRGAKKFIQFLQLIYQEQLKVCEQSHTIITNLAVDLPLIFFTRYYKRVSQAQLVVTTTVKFNAEKFVEVFGHPQTFSKFIVIDTISRKKNGLELVPNPNPQPEGPTLSPAA